MTTRNDRRFSTGEIATAAALRLAGMRGEMDPAWVAVIAKNGIELAAPGSFTIDLESGQRFVVQVTEDLLTPDDARIWVAVDAFDPTQILTLPLGTRAEVQWWLDQQYDDVDGFPKVITVGEYRASGRNGQYEAQIAGAAKEFQPPAIESEDR